MGWAAQIGVFTVASDALKPTVEVNSLILGEPVAGIRRCNQHVDILLEVGPTSRVTIVAPLDAVEDPIPIHVVRFTEEVTGDQEREFGNTLRGESVWVLGVEIHEVGVE